MDHSGSQDISSSQSESIGEHLVGIKSLQLIAIASVRGARCAAFVTDIQHAIRSVAVLNYIVRVADDRGVQVILRLCSAPRSRRRQRQHLRVSTVPAKWAH